MSVKSFKPSNKMFKLKFPVLFFAIWLFAKSSSASFNGQNGVQQSPELQAFIKESIENFRSQMKTGTPELNIPVLDPLRMTNVDVLDITIPDNIATIKFKVEEMTMHGLSKFRFHEFSPDFGKLYTKLNMSLPRVVTNGIYDLDIKLFNIFPMKGNGNFTTILTNGVLTGGGGMEHAGDTFQIRHLDMDVAFQDFRVRFRNFMGLGPIADSFQDMFPGIARNFFDGTKHMFLNAMNCLAKEEINKYLKKPEVKAVIQSLMSDDDDEDEE